jgi:hypothetical protein
MLLMTLWQKPRRDFLPILHYPANPHSARALTVTRSLQAGVRAR